jgi:hypothetical protein
MTQKLSLGRKSKLLVLLGSSVATIGLCIMVLRHPSFNLSKFVSNFQSIKELLGFYMLFVFITAVFGVPILHLIEKFFSRYRLRYIVGSIFSSYFFYSVFNAFPQMQGIWVFTDRQYGMPPAFYVIPGFLTGLIFTFLVWWLESREN